MKGEIDMKHLKKLLLILCMAALMILVVPCKAQAASNFSLSKKSITLAPGSIKQIVIKNLKENAKVKFTVTASSKNIKITTKSDGTITVKALSNKKVKGDQKVKVKVKASITLAKLKTISKTFTFNVNIKGAVQKGAVDYTSAEDLEADLDAKRNVSGKTAEIVVTKISSLKSLGYGFNLKAGKKLNFCSVLDPDVTVGSKITVKITKSIKVPIVGHVIIYKLL